MTHFDIYEAVVYKGEDIQVGILNDQPMIWLLCEHVLLDESRFQIQMAFARQQGFTR